MNGNKPSFGPAVTASRPSRLPRNRGSQWHSARAGADHRAQHSRGGATGRSSSGVPERRGRREELEGDVVVAPSKEIGVAAHPSDRSMLRR
jgi:hypothetical protein